MSIDTWNMLSIPAVAATTHLYWCVRYNLVQKPLVLVSVSIGAVFGSSQMSTPLFHHQLWYQYMWTTETKHISPFRIRSCSSKISTWSFWYLPPSFYNVFLHAYTLLDRISIAVMVTLSVVRLALGELHEVDSHKFAMNPWWYPRKSPPHHLTTLASPRNCLIQSCIHHRPAKVLVRWSSKVLAQVTVVSKHLCLDTYLEEHGSP